MEKIEEKPTVENNEIYNMDCYEFLKLVSDETVDACITDPPYYGVIDEEWDNQWKNIHEYTEWTSKWVSELSRILKKSGSFFIFGFSYQLSHLLPIIESHGFKFRQQIVIWKGMKSAAGRVSSKLKMFPTTTEYLFYFVKDSTNYIRALLQEKADKQGLTAKQINEYLGKATNGGGTWSTIAGKKQKNIQEPTKEDWEKLSVLFGGLPRYEDLVYTFNLPMGVTDVFDDINFYIPKEEKIHPTEKPIKLIERILLSCTNEGDIVVDPFMGSGATAISCLKNNRFYIGSELDFEYYNRSKLRIQHDKKNIFK